MTATESLTIRIEKPVKQNLSDLASKTDRSMSYHADRAISEYVSRERRRLELLAEEIHEGIASLDAGKGVRMSDSLFADIKKRGRERLKKLP